MIAGIKKRIEKELLHYLKDADQLYSLKKVSPILFSKIRDFISRPGKRLRPTLFVIGYLGYTSRPAPGLYRSAISLELLHDFMLVHDDIIDKSATRRGKPSMHTILNKLISKRKDIKFNGQDLAIIVGDVIFAMAFGAFLAINEDPRRKESALKKLIAATIYTGSGEFIELLAGLKAIDKITQGQIYHIYDYKTANYTFSSPLVMGAILAGADKEEINKLFKYGIYLGRAFQINDDILGMFGSQEKIGKSVLSDVQEAKKTLIIWHAFHHSAKKKQQLIKRIFAQKKIGRDELLTMRKIILASGALDFARAQVASLLKKAELLSQSLQMRPKYKKALINYSRKMLSI